MSVDAYYRGLWWHHLFVWLVLFMVVGCASLTSYPEPQQQDDVISLSQGCKHLAGQQRLDCIRKVNQLCAQASNVRAENTMLSKERHGSMVVQTYELCLVGESGHKFACYKYHRTTYSPSLLDRLADYGIIAALAFGGGFVAGKFVITKILFWFLL